MQTADKYQNTSCGFNPTCLKDSRLQGNPEQIPKKIYLAWISVGKIESKIP